jgi:hypothetical protein
MRRYWVFLLLLVACSDTGSYRLNLVFDHPDVVEVEVWALEPGEQICDDFLSHLADPGSATVVSGAVIPVPPEDKVLLGDIPAGEALFVAEGRTAAGAKILRGCSRYDVKAGGNNYIAIELTQVCWPEPEDLSNQQDDDCDTLVDECDQGAECNDGLYCTEGDICADGDCNGTARDCDDADDCTIDTCDDDLDQCVNTLDPRPGAEGLAQPGTCSNSIDDDCDGLTDQEGRRR